MSRVALVTGGTRGIDAATCKVAANYGGNDWAAQRFNVETGIPVYKWDVSSFDACVMGVKQVEAEIGPIDVRERKFGRIINISSINGQKGQFGQVNYSASKAGEIGFTKALAQEGARVGITVNAICPDYIATDMVKAMSPEVLSEKVLPQIPIGRLGEPEEIALVWFSWPPTMPG
jgi:acetoacetyl-CoA reductase